MSKVLCTFSGPNGDILWSLPTAKAIASLGEGKVDFAMMPDYEKLIPLIEAQPYIDKAFVVPDWSRWHSNHGDQPWQPPKHIEEAYERSYHLTYRSHPGLGGVRLPLIDFTANQQGIKLKDPLPFLTVPQVVDHDEFIEFVAVAFNAQYVEVKAQFLKALEDKMPDVVFVDVTKLPWVKTANIIKNAIAFVGCRSSNYVIANGVGQKNIFTFEPHPSRNMYGHLGDIFGCPYSREVSAPTNMPIHAQVDMAAQHIEEWALQSKGERVA